MFCTRPCWAERLVSAGAAGVVVDWERRGKHRRQAGADTQINSDTPTDLSALGAVNPGRILCRVNSWGPQTAAEIELALALGADEVLLPMVRTTEEVDAALGVVGGRGALGILIETDDAVRRAADLARRPLSRIYVGLNDLMIDRGGRELFAPLIDGTVEGVARVAAAARIPFGVAGITRPDAGSPVPCRLLTAELARLGASFTFLRRSFHADMVGRDPDVEVPRILAAVDAARARQPDEVTADQAELRAAVARAADGITAPQPQLV